MATPPQLPAPFPELDFPVTEGMRQQMVRAYRAMLQDLEGAIDKVLAAQPDAPVAKSEAGFMGAVQAKQEVRRLRVMRVLRQLGVPKSAFAEGGAYANTSDDALREEAKRLLQERRAAR